MTSRTASGALLCALLLAGCLPELIDEDATVTSVESAPPDSSPEKQPPPAADLSSSTDLSPAADLSSTTLDRMSDRAGLDLVPAPPADDAHRLAVTARAAGPNVVVVEASYAPGSPLPRPVLPGGAKLLSEAHTDGGSIWRIRPPVKGSHAYGAEIANGETRSTMSVSCCAPPQYADPVLPPAPGQPSVDQVDLAR